MILLAKVMVQPQSANILDRIAGEDRLVTTNNSSVLRIDGGAESDLGVIRIDKFLDGGIEKSRRDLYETLSCIALTVGHHLCVRGYLLWGQGDARRQNNNGFCRDHGRRDATRIRGIS